MTQKVQKEMVQSLTYVGDAIDTRNVAIANTAPQQLNPNHVMIRPGTLRDYARFRLWLGISKSGTADTATTNIYFGPNGDNTDALIGTVSALATTNRSQGLMLIYKRLSATSIQRQGGGNLSSSYSGGATAVAYPTAVAVADMDANPMYLSIYNTMTTGAEVFAVEDYFLELIPSDSAT